MKPTYGVPMYPAQWIIDEPHLSPKKADLDVIQSHPLCRMHYGQCENISYVYCWEDLVLWRHGESSPRAWEELHLLVSGETGDTLFLHLQSLPFSLWMRACNWRTHTVFMHCWVHFTYKCIFATKHWFVCVILHTACTSLLAVRRSFPSLGNISICT